MTQNEYTSILSSRMSKLMEDGLSKEEAYKEAVRTLSNEGINPPNTNNSNGNSILNQKLNEDNLKDVTAYVKNVTSDKNVTYKINEKGKVTIYKDGKPFVSGLTTENTVNEAIVKINLNLEKNTPKNKGNVPRINVSLGKLYNSLDVYKGIGGDLGNIKLETSFITGDLLKEYSGLNDKTSVMLLLLNEYVSSLQGHIGTAINLYLKADKANYSKLQDIVNELFESIDQTDKAYQSVVNYNPNKKNTISQEAFNTVLNAAFNQSSELPTGFLNEMIEGCNYLTSKDKEYIHNQLEKGNVRSSIGLILEIQARSELDACKARVKELKDVRDAFNREYAKKNGAYDVNLINHMDEAQKALDEAIKKSKIQERIVNQYSQSRKEWEYDCYLKKVQEGEYSASFALNINLYKEAIKYYYNDDDFVRENATDMGVQIADNFMKDENFYKWLSSDECKIENKEAYLETLNNLKNHPSFNKAAYYLAATELRNDENYNNRFFGEDYYHNYFDYDNKIKRDEFSLQHLDDEHLKVYNFLYETEGAEKAHEFIDAMSDSVNKKSGLEKANEAFNRIINGENASHVLGLLSSNFEGIKLGTEQWFDVVSSVLDNKGQLS